MVKLKGAPGLPGAPLCIPLYSSNTAPLLALVAIAA